MTTKVRLDDPDDITLYCTGPTTDPFPYPVDPPHYPDDNPKTQFGLKKVPMHLVPPIAIAQMSLAFENGAGKYGPFNWREKTISSTVYYGAAMRHLQAWYDGEDFAPDSGVHHLAHVMACCAMVLDGRLVLAGALVNGTSSTQVAQMTARFQ